RPGRNRPPRRRRRPGRHPVRRQRRLLRRPRRGRPAGPRRPRHRPARRPDADAARPHRPREPEAGGPAMIERGGGRTSGQTDWHLMDVNSMWACLQDHDTTNHWKQVAGWRKVCDLAQIHLGRLQEYRRGLAEAWPPETSAASGTYLAQLDDLIAKVRHTHDAA